jgi:5'-nucleotidase
MKQRLYIDMDGVIVDFESALCKVDNETLEKYNGVLDEIPGLFDLMEPMPGAIEAVNELAQQFDTYILSTAPWLNPSSCSSKVNWIHRYFGSDKDSPLYKRVIITHHKNLLKGEFLIDDRLKNGVDGFEGEHIHFGTPEFSGWNTVLNYLITKKATDSFTHLIEPV